MYNALKAPPKLFAVTMIRSPIGSNPKVLLKLVYCYCIPLCVSTNLLFFLKAISVFVRFNVSVGLTMNANLIILGTHRPNPR